VPYLIDGNNLLGSWGGPQSGRDRRHEVVQRVAAFCRAQGARAILVFDGAPLRGEIPAQDLGPVAVRVPPAGRDADSVIRALVDEPGRAKDLVVVSSDKALYSYARTRGARVLRAHEWNALERTSTRGASRPEAKRSGSASSPEKPEREDDVEGWLERFNRRS